VRPTTDNVRAEKTHDGIRTSDRVTAAPPDKCVGQSNQHGSTFGIGLCVNKLEVWNQIRRTEEEAMEMGTMEHALLPDHGVETECAMRVVAMLSSIEA
jgi:hypothetical protein